MTLKEAITVLERYRAIDIKDSIGENEIWREESKRIDDALDVALKALNGLEALQRVLKEKCGNP